EARGVGVRSAFPDRQCPFEELHRLAVETLFGQRLAKLPGCASEDGMLRAYKTLPRVDRALVESMCAREVAQAGVQNGEVLNNGRNARVIRPEPSLVNGQRSLVQRPRRYELPLDLKVSR